MKKKIVIVEDNVMLNRILEYRLKNDGYEVGVYVNGEDAIAYMIENSFDLLITDLYMPLMNGMEVIQSVRDKISKSVPIVVISAAHEEELINRVFKLGADDFIVKPFRAGELSVRVKRLLE